MNKKFLTFAVVIVASSMALTACKKSGNNQGSQIVGVTAKPIQEAQPQDSDADETLEESRDKGKIVPEERDPQDGRKTPPIEDDCEFGGENICADEDKTGDQEPVTEQPTEPDNSEATDQAPIAEKPVEEAPATEQAPEAVNDQVAAVPLSRYYTSAAQDGYRDHLQALMKEKMAAKTSQQRNDYYANAESVTNVKTIIQDGLMQVSVDFEVNGKRKTSILGGPIDSASGSVRLVSMNKSMAAKQPGSVFDTRTISGVAVCAEAEAGKCFVSVIRLTVGQTKKLPLWIVSRSTNADIAVPKRTDFEGSSSAKKFYDYFFKTKYRIDESLKFVIIDSFEVINGITGMKITSVMHDNEVVSANGLLLAPRDSILTNMKWKKELELDDLSFNADARSGFKTSLQNIVREVRLLTNDSRREFTLNYAFLDGGDQNVTYLRMQPLVIDIGEIGRIMRSMNPASEL